MLDRGADTFPVDLAAAARELLVLPPQEAMSALVNLLQKLLWHPERSEGESGKGGEDAANKDTPAYYGEHTPLPARKPCSDAVEVELEVYQPKSSCGKRKT